MSILANIIQTKYLSSKKVWFHLMQSNKCIKCKILICDLGLDHYLGFFYLFWPILFKPSSYHTRRFDGI